MSGSLIILGNSIFCHNRKFRFQKVKFCSDAIVRLTEYINYTAINDKEHVVSVFLDLKKAYGTVNHDVLLTKLNAYGVEV